MKKSDNIKNKNLLWTYSGKDKKSLMTAVIVRSTAIVFSIIAPLLASRVIADLALSEYVIVIVVAGALTIMRITGNVSNHVACFYYKKAYVKAVEQLHFDMEDAILRMKLSVVDKNGTGVFIKRMNDDAEVVTKGTIDMTDRLVSIAEVIGVLVATAFISREVFAFEILSFCILYFWEKGFTKKIRPYLLNSKIENEKHDTLILETIRAHLEIKSLNCEKRFLEELRASDEYVDKLFLSRVLKSFYNGSWFAVYKGASDFLYIVLLVLLCTQKHFLPVTAIILYNYHGQLSNGTETIQNLADSLRDIRISMDRISDLFDDIKFPKNSYGNVSREKLFGDVEFRNVDFGYENGENNGENNGRVEVLKNLNLHIRPGESVAFVGASGCGKSTILKLISRFYDPDSGNIYIDGVDSREYDKKSLRGNITLINQNTYIFDKTIRENLVLFKPDLTEEQMISACKAACIHDEIMKFPDGYDTRVGEGGVVLSGGQGQRIAFVRAILRNTPIIMLDESTSALDNITQSNVLKYIKQIGSGKTMITVAHRLSTIVDCDRIYFIDKGTVAAQGTHDELMKSCEGYRKLYSTDDKKE